MTITRAGLEMKMIHRRGKTMLYVGFDNTTVDGTNADLTDSFESAIHLLQGATQISNVVTDTDLASVPDDLQAAIPLASEMFLISTLRAQILQVDQTTGPFSAKLSQLPDRLLADWKELRKALEEQFNIGGPELVPGVLELNFASHGSEDEDGTDI